MDIGLHIKYPSLVSDFNETCIFFGQIFERYPNIKFHENPSSGSRVVPCGRTDIHEAIRPFSQFCERAPPPKKKPVSPLLNISSRYNFFGLHLLFTLLIFVTETPAFVVQGMRL